MGPTACVHAFVTQELVYVCVLPQFEGNEEETAQEECHSSDLAVSRPLGYIIPVRWLTLLPFSFMPADSTIGYY